MQKAHFLQILDQILASFEEAEFRAAYADAKAKGDVQRLMELTTAVQRKAFGALGLDETEGGALFKEAGRKFGLDGDIAPRLARMKAALSR